MQHETHIIMVAQLREWLSHWSAADLTPWARGIEPARYGISQHASPDAALRALLLHAIRQLHTCRMATGSDNDVLARLCQKTIAPDKHFWRR